MKVHMATPAHTEAELLRNHTGASMKVPKKRVSRARVRVETWGKHTVLVVAGKPVRLTPERCVELSAELINAEMLAIRAEQAGASQ